MLGVFGGGDADVGVAEGSEDVFEEEDAALLRLGEDAVAEGNALDVGAAHADGLLDLGVGPGASLVEDLDVGGVDDGIEYLGGGYGDVEGVVVDADVVGLYLGEVEAGMDAAFDDEVDAVFLVAALLALAVADEVFAAEGGAVELGDVADADDEVLGLLYFEGLGLEEPEEVALRGDAVDGPEEGEDEECEGGEAEEVARQAAVAALEEAEEASQGLFRLAPEGVLLLRLGGAALVGVGGRGVGGCRLDGLGVAGLIVGVCVVAHGLGKFDVYVFEADVSEDGGEHDTGVPLGVVEDAVVVEVLTDAFLALREDVELLLVGELGAQAAGFLVFQADALGGDVEGDELGMGEGEGDGLVVLVDACVLHAEVLHGYAGFEVGDGGVEDLAFAEGVPAGVVNFDELLDGVFDGADVARGLKGYGLGVELLREGVLVAA